MTVSGPITDDIGYRFSAVGSTIDDFTDNAYDGDKLNGADEWSVRGKLRWFPVADLELKWASDYSDLSNNASAAPLRSLEPFGGNEEQVQAILDNIAPVRPGEENEDVIAPNAYNHRYGKDAGRTFGLEMRYRWF